MSGFFEIVLFERLVFFFWILYTVIFFCWLIFFSNKQEYKVTLLFIWLISSLFLNLFLFFFVLKSIFQLSVIIANKNQLFQQLNNEIVQYLINVEKIKFLGDISTNYYNILGDLTNIFIF